MRTYQKNNNGQWEQIDDPNFIYLVTLIQTLLLFENESPIYGNYGIPAYDSIMTQLAPNAAISRTQQQYSQYFSSLSIVKDESIIEPTYRANVVLLNGTVVQEIIIMNNT